MVNKQQGQAPTVAKAQRTLGAKVTDDPGDVLAVLQTARRLLDEGGELFKDGWQEKRSKKPTRYSAMGALRAAIDLAHPKDRSRAIWAAQYALQSAMEKDPSGVNGIAHLPKPVITRWESHPRTTLEDAIRVYDAAIRNQGKVNQTVSKAKGRK
jgi:hypothetical protein